MAELTARQTLSPPFGQSLLGNTVSAQQAVKRPAPTHQEPPMVKSDPCLNHRDQRGRYLFNTARRSYSTSPSHQAVPDRVRVNVEREVTAVIHAYKSGHTAARCNDVTPVSKLVKDGMIFVTASKVVAITLAQTERELRTMVCGWASHTGTVDSVTVDVLDQNIAVAAWLYHGEEKLKSGEIKRYKGSALITFVRSSDGWKISSTMAALE